MVRDYTERTGEGRKPHDVFYYRDAQQHTSKLRRYARLLRDLGDSAGSVLDLGCGGGELLRWYEPPCGYLGVDAVPVFVHAAQRRFPTHEFACLNVLDGLPVEAFETVVMVGALGLSPQPVDLLRVAARAAAGHLIFDYLAASGSAAKHPWLRTIRDETVEDIVAGQQMTCVQRVELGTSTVLLHYAKTFSGGHPSYPRSAEM
jgi:SAM-dependent methyltransferase